MTIEDTGWIVIDEDEQQHMDNSINHNQQCNDTIESIDLSIVRNENFCRDFVATSFVDVATIRQCDIREYRQCDIETTIFELLERWRSVFQTLKICVIRFFKKSS